MAGGINYVFENSKQFRNGSIDLTHNLEFNTAYYNDLMNMTQNFLYPDGVRCHLLAPTFSSILLRSTQPVISKFNAISLKFSIYAQSKDTILAYGSALIDKNLTGFPTNKVAPEFDVKSTGFRKD